MTPNKTISSLGSLNAVVDTEVDDADYVVVQISNTWSGTITFQASLDSVTWHNITLTNASDVDKHAAASSTTANGMFFHETMGVCHLRVKMTSYTSGTANLVICNKRTSK